MIASLTTSDLRNTLCGRLKLQKNQKMKITLSQIQSDPLLAQICYFCDFSHVCHGCFQLARELLVTFAFLRYLGTFRNLSSFLLFLSLGILLNLLFLRFLRYLSRVFLARKKNPCYFCDFCDICGHFGALLGFFFF